MRRRRGILLFEVALVVLLVSVGSVFLFRGYSLFLKTGRKSADYLKMILLTEKKICDLYIKEKNEGLNLSVKKEENWDIEWQDSIYDDLKIVNLKINYAGRGKIFLDTTICLIVQEEE